MQSRCRPDHRFRPALESLEIRDVPAAPGDAPLLPPPPPPSAEVIHVDTVGELEAAVANLQSGQTVVIQPGVYQLTRTLFIGQNRQVQNVTLRGATNDFNDVVIKGLGMDGPFVGSLAFGISVYNAQDVTIANLSVGEVYYHAIDLQGIQGADRIHIYHCRLYDAGEQIIKSSAGGGGVDDCSLEYSLVEYTSSPSVIDHGGGTGYSGALHAHETDRWQIRHNLFRNFHTPDTVTHTFAPTVLMWNGSADTLVEANTFIDCDRAVAFGLVDKVGAFDHQGGVIRNNFVYQRPGLFSAARRSGSDAQLLVYDSPGTRVYHNTVLTNGNSRLSIEVRWANSGVAFENNLADAPLGQRDGGVYSAAGNFLSTTTSMFVNAAAVDLHLLDNSATRASVIDRAVAILGASTDFDGESRPAGAAADVGADEYFSAANSPPAAQDDAAATPEDTAVTVPVLANDSDPDGQALSVVAVTQGAHGAVTRNGDGTVTYTPAANFNGDDAFTYTVADGAGGSATATVQITVTPVNDAPVAVADSAATAHNQPVDVPVLDNDVDVDGDILNVIAFSQAANGTVSLNTDASLRYVPRAGFAGEDTFTYTVADPAGASAVGQVSVTVNPAPTGDGLTATYYDNINFTGATFTRIDPTIDFDWGRGSPVPGFGANTFSVRWRGQVQPEFSETYTFYAATDDGARVWINGQLVIDNWSNPKGRQGRGAITLQAGQRYDIRMDYFEDTGNARARLLWSSPSVSKQVIPTARLFSTTATDPAAPTNLSAAPVSDSSIRVIWTDNSTNETGFRVERSLDGVNFAQVATVAANVTSFDDSGLNPATTYHYRVFALSAVGNSPASATVTARTAERVIHVNNSTEFRHAVSTATAGTRILLNPGVYQGDNYFSNVQGEAGRPIVIAAADPANRPILQGGGEGLHFSDAAHLELRDLIIEGAAQNGINIDDAGTYDSPAHHITLSGLTVRNVGTTGNQDGIKLSGVQQFVVENCSISVWGAGGSGIDMVGCHDGVIAGSSFAHGDLTGANGVQIKGGSTRITVRDNRFEHAGARAVQIGGSTGLEFFRPQPPAGYEAKDVMVEGNVIIGSQAAVAFVNVDGATVRFNTIYRPTRWVIRILQETTAPGFVPSRNGVFTDNIVAFRTDEIAATVNIGPSTAPETFTFARNWWYALNDPARSTPTLPTAESEGTYGIDPQFVDAAAGDLHLRSGSPASAVGAYAPRG